jgi:imidazolonepropionase-like amidohydrolase
VQPAAPQKVTAVRAGRLIDPETGAVSTNQIIVVEGERIRAVGSNVAIPAGVEVIDLSKLTVLPGLVDAHAH